jgi:predicted regulator of Ras-like GTPase activity (Roadblock/LC7/MglB family)
MLAEMRALRDRVIGITDTALSSRDGLIITADTADLEPDTMAALGAASLGLAQRMAAEVGKGLLRQAVTRSSGGYVAIYAVGSGARMVVWTAPGWTAKPWRRSAPWRPCWLPSPGAAGARP